MYTKMTHLQVQWYNKLVDEIVRRYVEEVRRRAPHHTRSPSPFARERRTNSCTSSTKTFAYAANANRTIRPRNRSMSKAAPACRTFVWRRETTIAKKITGRNVVFPLLRACTHPYLLDAPRDENGEIIINEELISSSGKFILLDKMLAKLQGTSHKVGLARRCTSQLEMVVCRCSSSPRWSSSSICSSRCASTATTGTPDSTEAHRSRNASKRYVRHSSVPSPRPMSFRSDHRVQQRTRNFRFPDQHTRWWPRVELDGGGHRRALQFRLGTQARTSDDMIDLLLARRIQ